MNNTRFRASVVLVAFLAAFAGCSSDPDTIVLENPAISSINPGAAGYGDTIFVSGWGFGPNPSANAIVISPGRFNMPAARRVIVPFSGSETELRGIVPDGAFTGSVRVERANRVGKMLSLALEPPASASAELPFDVTLDAGDVGKSFFSGSEYSFSLTAGAASEDYLVVIFSEKVPLGARLHPVNADTFHIYRLVSSVSTRVAGGVAGTAAASAQGPRAVSRAGASGQQAPSLPRDLAAGASGSRRGDFERRVDLEIRGVLRTGAGASRRGGPVRSPALSPAAPQATFKVLVDPNGSIFDPDNFTTVTANLKFDGDHTLLYVDAETPQSCFSDADAALLGAAYDVNIYPTDRSAFGNESDINHDGKVVILMTPMVNRMIPAGEAGGSQGYIAGFFLAVDLLPEHAPSISNGMEIFYTMVPDPSTPPLFGNTFPKDDTIDMIQGVLAHEFLHMILFNYRALIYDDGIYAGGYLEDLWISEALANIAENLNGFDASNIRRANLFLANPGSATLIYGGQLLREQGAAFLFLRHLGDRYGERIYKNLVQSKKTGTANVEAATGAYFNELFADWAAATYLDDRGITSDPRFNYSSLNLQDTSGDPHYEPVLTIPGSTSGLVWRWVKVMALEYVRYTIPAGTTVDFTITALASTGRMNVVVIRTR